MLQIYVKRLSFFLLKFGATVRVQSKNMFNNHFIVKKMQLNTNLYMILDLLQYMSELRSGSMICFVFMDLDLKSYR